MNESAKKVLNYLTGYTDINAVAVEDVRKLAAENPYFPITQFLLAEKLKSESEEEYTLQAKKASLYFSNPYWLKYQLTEQQVDKELTDYQIPSVSPENEYEPSSASINSFGELAATSTPLHTNTTNINEESSEILRPEKYEDTASHDPKALETSNTETAVHNADVRELPSIPQVEEEQAAELRNTNEAAEAFINNLDTNTVSTVTDRDNFTVLSADAETEVIELKEEMAGVTHSSDATTERFLDESEKNSHNEELPQDDEHDRMFQNIKAMLDASSEEADADTKDAVIPMDPYYTIDYFASQGIKLELDSNPQDQLGQNLKKFTQWLKHMKKLGPEDATEAINRTESEADIQQIADSSNTVREVVTEAMAMVLEKQGKKDKAIELYNKLSFLNPPKRAYFADKIKILKGI